MLRHIIVGYEAKASIQDELFQEIALNIWKAIPSFRGQASGKTFVARIAQNVLATHVAKSVRTIKTDNSVDGGDASHQQACDKTPYHELDQKQRQQKLIHAIRSLSLEYQQVITLALEGMSYSEIAETLAITTNLVGVRLQRAKQKLTQILEEV